MQEKFLPIGKFRFANEVAISERLNMPINSTIGYFIELDLEHPLSIHDQLKAYLFASVKEMVLDVWLRQFQIDIKKWFNIPQAKVSKLLQTMYDKKHYVLQFKLIQL